jgi:single-stranded-DNA-specific exonuclease
MQFLFPDRSQLNDPFQLDNMKIVVDKIKNNISNNNKIEIYADIDTDGVTSTAMMYRYLKHFTDNVFIKYHQRNDGHGVKPKNIDNDTKLLIIVDSSTNSVNECRILNNNGIDIVILDHHQKEIENPFATIVNPHMCNYKNKSLSGAGVTWQTCRAFDLIMNTNYSDLYIDLACVGNVGDMMNVSEPETRYIIWEGLQKIHNKNANLGILVALKKMKKDYKPNATDLAFSLIPMINSSIRLNHIEDVIKLLTSDNEQECKDIVKKCVNSNDKRKTIDNSHSIIFVNTTELKVQSGLLGLIANDIAGKYKKPCLVVCEDNGVLFGSGRSYGGIKNLKDILQSTNLFNFVAGHQSSFGVEFNKENTSKIIKKLDELLKDDNLEITIKYDLEFKKQDITFELLNEIKDISFICGEGFPEPLFLIKDIECSEVNTMGKENNHLKTNDNDIELVKFFIEQDDVNALQDSLSIDVIGKLNVNSWYNFGKKKMVYTKQIMIDDFNAFIL